MIESRYIWEQDPYLKPYKPVLWRRQQMREAKAAEITGAHGSLAKAVNNHLYYGVHKTKEGWVCREWAPHATGLYLLGECNGWKRRLCISSGRWRRLGIAFAGTKNWYTVNCTNGL